MILADEIEAESVPGTLSSRVFIYGVLATLAVAVIMALAATGLYLATASRLADAEHALADARATSDTCRMQAARVEGKLEQYDKWITLVREGKRPLLGGVGGP